MLKSKLELLTSQPALRDEPLAEEPPAEEADFSLLSSAENVNLINVINNVKHSQERAKQLIH